MLGTGSGTSRRAVSASDCWAISPAPAATLSLSITVPLLSSISVKEVWVGLSPCFRMLAAVLESSENYPRPKEEEGGTSDQKRGRCAVSLKSPLFFPPHPERTMPQEQCHTSHTAATRLRLERPLTREPRQQCLDAASPLAAPGVWGLKWRF